jgi:DNA-binding beta-propeller fold protein YncE
MKSPTASAGRASSLLVAFSLVSALAATAVAQAPPDTAYHIVRDIRLGGDGRWDYVAVDTASRRLFIARQTRVMVVDPESGKLLGEIPGLSGAHGVALAYAAGHGFATSGHDSSVTMFDLRTLKVLRRTKAADDADAVLYDPASKRVFTFNGDAGSSTAIDPVTGDVVGTVPLGGKPEFGVTDGHGKLYVNLEDKGEVVEIEPARLRVTRRWSIAPCEEPTGLAIDRAHHLLFSGCHNRVMAISDAAAGRKIAEVPIGEGVDAGAFDPSTQLAFASNGDGTITVVHEDSPTTFHVVSTAATRRGARTMALDERTHRLYTVTAAFGDTPAPTEEEPHPRPTLVPGTFSLLVLDR